MSQQPASGRTGLAPSDVTQDNHPDSGHGQQSSSLSPTRPVRVATSPASWCAASRTPVYRRIAIGTVSTVLVLVALFAPGFGPRPRFADSVSSTGTGWDRSEPLPASGRASSALWKVMLASQPLQGTSPASQDSGWAQLPEWVQTLRTTTLWPRSTEMPITPVSVPPRTSVRVLGQAENGWLPVAYDSPDAGGQTIDAWVRLSDVLPSDQQRVEASSRGGARPTTPDISTPEKFIAAVAEAAQESQRDSGVPCSVTIAQAILESDWGKSLLAKNGNNFFGIKATRGPGTAGVISMDTWEVLSGRNVVVKDAFRAYNNLLESVIDHGRFLADNARYAPAFKFANSPQEFARQIAAAGYATDPSYATKLINLMNKYNLYQFDLSP